MKNVKVRIMASTFEQLKLHLFAHYPHGETAAFLDCQWAEGTNDLMVTINSLVLPKEGEVISRRGRVTLCEPYTLRTVLAGEKRKHAIGLIHSHPQDCGTWPSRIDDEMDSYYAEYYGQFLPTRPFISMILSQSSEGNLRFSGRAWDGDRWLRCSDLQIAGHETLKLFGETVAIKEPSDEIQSRVARVTGLVGAGSATQLWNARIGIMGGGGTGSAAFESLVRACAGEIVIVDPDMLSASNAERFHGFRDEYIRAPIKKVDALFEHARAINPNVVVRALPFSSSDPRAEAALLECDFLLGCTDTQTGRLEAADLAMRYLIPCIHVAVAMETNDEKEITGEIIHLTQFGPGLPCPHCRQQVNSQKLAQELMSPEERKARQRQADESQIWQREQYWVNEPVIHTVGTLTTIAGELAAGFATGLITQTRKLPSTFLEIDLAHLLKGALPLPVRRKKGCTCNGREGAAGQKNPWLPRTPINLCHASNESCANAEAAPCPNF